MSYKDERGEKAYFRGVPFYLETSSRKGGRRYQNHQYPQRDKNYFEDLGLAASLRNIRGFVVGDNYHKQRDALLDALEEEGQGQFIHPWMGSVDVCVGEIECTESRSEQGIAYFTIEFIPYFPQAFPSASVNTSWLLSQVRNLLTQAGLGSFLEVFNNISSGLVNVRAVIQGVSNAFNVIQNVLGEVVNGIGSAADFVDMIIKTPDRFTDMVSAYYNQAAVIVDRFNSNNGSSYTKTLANVGGYLIQTDALFTQTVVAGSETEQAINAVNQLVQQILIITIGDELASMPVADGSVIHNTAPSVEQQTITPVEYPQVPVVEDIMNIREQVLDLIWDASQQLTPIEYPLLNDYRQKLTDHLNAVAASGVRLKTITPLAVTSSLLLAYEYFGDATRHKEIEQRNKVSQRNFINPEPLQITGN